MSVIKTVVAVPNRVEQFWLYLAANAPKGLPKSDLEQLFSPPSLGKAGDDGEGEAGGEIFKGVLSELQALGFVEWSKEDGIIVPLLPPEGKKSLEQKRQWFFEELRRILTTPGEAQEKGQDNVPLALAWVVLQSPDHPLSFKMAKSVEISSAFPGNNNLFDLNLQARLQQGYYWARYLGLCTFSAYKGEQIVVPDSTAAVRSLLPAIFDGETELPASAFLTRLGTLCPVLERGEARRIVLSQAAHPGDFPGNDELSGSTGLAMHRLMSEGVIGLENRSDALEPCMIDVCSYRTRFSHIRLEGRSHGNG